MNKEKFERERERKIKALLKASTPEERKRIRKGLREGRILRKEVEKL